MMPSASIGVSKDADWQAGPLIYTYVRPDWLFPRSSLAIMAE